MSLYTQDIQTVVNSALSELSELHRSGKAVDAPIANNLFFVRWVSKTIKQQRFGREVSQDLIRWQKAGRSKGNNAGLELIFKRISGFYAQFFDQNLQGAPLTDAMIEQFLDQMIATNWDVSTSEPLVNAGKVQFFTEGLNSLALCSVQCDDCFEGELLVKPMHWFVRGNHAQFVEMAAAAGFMVHKVTDYKSNVKYHGEYLVYPHNQGTQLAEIPLHFKVD
ncbi:DUF2913 family protein [Vibrio sp. FNV 38]|nr:DUF2913 family protein [Vibrio sp. FNV 38]